MSRSAAPARDNPLLVPSLEEWERLSPEEREARAASLTAALDAWEEEMGLMTEASRHFEARSHGQHVLALHFKKRGRRCFVGSDLCVLYPGENAFSPDLMVVFDVSSQHRSSWIVADERKAPDFTLEVISPESGRHDRVDKMNLYGRIRIPEYFLFEPIKLELEGYDLHGGSYRKLPAEDGAVYSRVLDLYLSCDDERLRFIKPDGAPLLFLDEFDNLADVLNGKLRQTENKWRQTEDKLREKEEEIARLAQQVREEKGRAAAAEEKLRRMRELLRGS